MSTAVSKSNLVGNLSLAISTSVWATMFPVTERLLQTWDPLSVTAGRITGGGLILLTALALSGNLQRTIVAAPWRKVILLGFVGVAISTLSFAWGIKHSGAVAAALVATTSPIIAALMARFVYSEPLRKGLIVGVTLAFAGGVCVVFGNGEGLDGFRGGEFFVLFAVIIWIWYSQSCQRWLSELPQLGIAALTMSAGALGMLAFMVAARLMGAIQLSIQPSAESLWLIAYLAAGPASFALFLWHFGVSRIGITIASMYSNLVPVVVVLVAIWFGVYPSILHLVGGVLIICGVLYAQLRNLP